MKEHGRCATRLFRVQQKCDDPGGIPINRTTMLKQEQEFKAWGLAKLAVRNIIIFFLIAETLAIVTLANVIVEQQRKHDETQHVLVQTKEQAAQKIEQLKNEQIETIREMGRIIERQSKLEHDISAMNNRVQKLKR